MLQREFGISAHEALHVRPAWELDNLLMHYVNEQRERLKQESQVG